VGVVLLAFLPDYLDFIDKPTLKKIGHYSHLALLLLVKAYF
jgi:hypothetical protein